MFHLRPIVVGVLLGPVVFLTRTARSDTEVGGQLPAQAVWTKAASPYRAVQNVEIPEGGALTIEPGAVVRFDRYTLIVAGQLAARGTRENPILLTSAQPAPRAGDWLGVQIKPTSPRAELDPQGNYQRGTIMEHCTVEYGTGMVIERCAPLITDCTIRHNAKKEGGGVLVWHCSPLLRRCQIVYNNSESAGGGIRTVGSAPQIEECRIAFNSAERGSGGGVSSDFSAPVILRNTIVHNVAVEGGGIATGAPSLGQGYLSGSDHSKPTISGNTITHNFAKLAGGGVSVEGSPTLTKNLIVNNGLAYGLLDLSDSQTDKPEIRKNHTGAGALIRGTYGGPAVVERNRIVHNLGARWGGGIMMVNASGRLRQNVIVDNAARDSGGGASLVLTTFWRSGARRDHGPSYDLLQNLVAGNAGGGIEFAGGGRQTASVQDSNISENRPFDLENRTNQQINAQNVWLGANDSAEIGRRIYDYFDNQTCGKLVCASADRALDLADLPDLPETLRQFYAAAPQDFRAGVALAPDDAGRLAVGLAWAAPGVKDVAGYRIYFDAHTLYTKSPFGNRGVCDQGRSPVDVGENTKAKLSGFLRGTVYSFAVAAYDSEGRETAYSKIIPINIPRQ
jgi:hypothetical protein